MRLIHIADTHLGCRQYDRLNRQGVNQREADIARTFERAVDQAIALDPDVIVFAGDVFHKVQPGNVAIVHAFGVFQKLRAALPACAVICVAGNHERPKQSETGCILLLLRQLGFHIAVSAPQRFAFPARDLSVLAVPELPKLPPLTPDADAKHNVLLLHGEIAGLLKHSVRPQVTVESLNAPSWTYVALGHWHEYREIAPNVCYSGSLDYTSSDVWSEIATPKGFIEVDLESGEKRFHEVAPERRHYDCEPIQANGLGADELTRLIGERLDSVPGGIDGAVVRLKVLECPSTVAKALDHGAIRKWKARALFLRLDIRKPVRDVSVIATMPKKTASLEELLRWRLEQQELPADVDRGELVRLGQHYMDKALESKEPKQEAPANAAA